MADLSPTTVQQMWGAKVTAGAAEENLDLSLNGAVAAASIAVPAGQTMEITDLVGGALAAAILRFEQSNNAGVAWFPLVQIRVPAASTVPLKLGTPLKITGGVGVLFRARVVTPGGATSVDATIMGVQGAVNA